MNGKMCFLGNIDTQAEHFLARNEKICEINNFNWLEKTKFVMLWWKKVVRMCSLQLDKAEWYSTETHYTEKLQSGEKKEHPTPLYHQSVLSTKRVYRTPFIKYWMQVSVKNSKIIYRMSPMGMDTHYGLVFVGVYNANVTIEFWYICEF